MRIEAALIIKEMWLNLGRYKSEFIPALVGDVFSVTLIKVTEIRREILFLLFDMINFETLSSRQFKFEKFQEAIVSATDVYFNQNLGDQSYVEACFHLPDHQFLRAIRNKFFGRSETVQNFGAVLYDEFWLRTGPISVTT